MVINGTRPCEPDFVLLRMVGDVLQRLAQCTQAIRLADDHGVERDAADQWLLGRLAQQLLELADDEVAKIVRRMVAPGSAGCR